MKKTKNSVTVVDPRSRIVEVRKVRAEDIAAHPGNWRDHPEAQAEAIAGVMREVGDVGVLLAWHSERNGGKLTLIDGHLRRGISPGHEYHVAITDLSDAEADYVLATHDPLAAMAKADAGALDALLSTVNSAETGVQKMLADLAKASGIDYAAQEADSEPQIDKAEELNQKWKVATGDLWRIGEHRLLCGDSTKAEDVARLMAGEVAQMMFTDPPYGVDYDGGHFHSGNVNIQRPRTKISGDSSASLYREFLQVVLPMVDGPCYMWFASTKSFEVYKALHDVEAEPHALIIWNKTNATYAAMNAQYKQRHEPCVYFKPKGCTLRWAGPTNECTVWDIPRDASNDLHPTQKPISLSKRAISNHDALIVIDAFAGSGSTLVSCENLKRKGRAIEISPAYCAVILERMATAFPALAIERVLS